MHFEFERAPLATEVLEEDTFVRRQNCLSVEVCAFEYVDGNHSLEKCDAYLPPSVLPQRSDCIRSGRRDPLCHFFCLGDADGQYQQRGSDWWPAKGLQ